MNSNPSLARRAFPALVLVGAAGTLVFALDRPTGTASGLDGAATADTESVTADETVLDTSQPPAMDGSDFVTTEVTTEATTGATTKSATGSTTKKSTTTEAPATTVAKTSSGCKSYSGPTIDTKWGPVQVKASVSSTGKICSVKVLQTPSGGKSTRINSRAVPILNTEAMSAQSAKIDAVSGATITSRAYKKSLQAVLDAA